jgi:hypothetical protein
MNVSKNVKEVEKIIKEKEEVFTIELNKSEITTLMIVIGKVGAASCMGQSKYHKHINNLWDSIRKVYPEYNWNEYDNVLDPKERSIEFIK